MIKYQTDKDIGIRVFKVGEGAQGINKFKIQKETIILFKLYYLFIK